MKTVQVIDAGIQAEAENAAWVRAKNPHISAELKEANDAGFRAGWRAAVAYLKLHKALRLD